MSGKRKPEQMTWDDFIEGERSKAERTKRESEAESKRKARNAQARERRKHLAPVIGVTGYPIPPLPAPGVIIRVDIRDWVKFKEAHQVKTVGYSPERGVFFVGPKAEGE